MCQWWLQEMSLPRQNYTKTHTLQWWAVFHLPTRCLFELQASDKERLRCYTRKLHIQYLPHSYNITLKRFPLKVFIADNIKNNCPPDSCALELSSILTNVAVYLCLLCSSLYLYSKYCTGMHNYRWLHKFTCENLLFKAITGSSGHASWCTVLEKYSLHYAKVPYIT